MPTATSHGPFRRRGFITAAAVLLVIVLLSVIAIVAGLFPSGEDNTTASDPTVAAPSLPAAETDSDPSVCGMKGYEKTSSLTTAPDIEWELVGTVAAPKDPAVGPGIVEPDGFRYCYSHTAEGALFAAANAYALGSDATLKSRAYELVAPGKGRDATRAASASDPASAGRFQYAGFSVLKYDGVSATIDLAFNRSSDGQLISFPTKLLWVEGDWKLVVTDGGQPAFPPAAIASLGGYTPWSGA